ncbi:MAG: YdcF family protein [Burkholderiaceae bacterium]
MLREFAWQFLLPPNGFVSLAFLASAWAALGRRWRRPAAWLAVLSLAVLALALSPPVTGSLADLLEARAGAPLTPDELGRRLAQADAPGAIVVLGAGMRGDSREPDGGFAVMPNALERALVGARLARASGLPVLVSGGATAGDQFRSAGHASEASLMARFMQEDLGVAPRWIESRSMTTADNARESARLLSAEGIGRVVLVTHAYHMPRARATFEAAGLRVMPAPMGFTAGHGMPARWLRSGVFDDRLWFVCHEFVGLLWYRWQGLLGPSSAS